MQASFVVLWFPCACVCMFSQIQANLAEWFLSLRNHNVQLPTDEPRRPPQASLIFLCLFVFLHNSLLKLMRFSSQLSRNSTWTIGSNKSWDGEKQLVFELTVGCLFIFQKLTWKTKDVEKCTVRGKNSVSIIFNTHTHTHVPPSRSLSLCFCSWFYFSLLLLSSFLSLLSFPAQWSIVISEEYV